MSASFDSITEQLQRGLYDIQAYGTGIRLMLQSDALDKLVLAKAALTERDRSEIMRGLQAIATIALAIEDKARSRADDIEQFARWTRDGTDFDDAALEEVAAMAYEPDEPEDAPNGPALTERSA